MKLGIRVKDCTACENGDHVVPDHGMQVTHSRTTGQLVFFKDGCFRGAMQAEEALSVLTIYWQGKSKLDKR